MFRLKARDSADLLAIRDHFAEIWPLAANRLNERDSRALIAAIDEELAFRATTTGRG